jgi:protoporphyrinogen oxidase
MMQDLATTPAIILGGGLAGISAALHLRRPYLLIEREERLGGLARTHERDGFYFDHTGHWLHLRSEEMKTLAQRLLGDELVEVKRRARIYSHERLTHYPFQANLNGLPAEVIHECLVGFVNGLLRRGDDEPRNFEQYILHHFGEGIAKHFMVPYNSKLWGVHPREITSAWCQRFVPRPNLEQVIAGAVGAGPPELGYNIRFRYPRHGGIETFTRALVGELDPQSVQLGTTVDQIYPRERRLVVGGESLHYHALMSTIPLPQLIALLDGVPDDVCRAASALRATPVRYLDVATRTPSPADYHWVYVPEEHLPFYRVGIFSNAMPSNAPKGCSSLYVELASRDSTSEQATRDALAALAEIGAIRSVEDVLFAQLRTIDPAYVVFDEHYESAVEQLHRYLEANRIFSRGRYGSWIYNAMEDSLLSGKDTASLIDQLAEEPTEPL